MRRVREVTAEEENFRTEAMGPGLDHMQICRRDPVEPEPAGTYVAMVFRVAGYDPDCDGSLMARLEQVDESGDGTGWCPKQLGLCPEACLVVKHPSELFALADDAPEHGT